MALRPGRQCFACRITGVAATFRWPRICSGRLPRRAPLVSMFVILSVPIPLGTRRTSTSNENNHAGGSFEPHPLNDTLPHHYTPPPDIFARPIPSLSRHRPPPAPNHLSQRRPPDH